MNGPAGSRDAPPNPAADLGPDSYTAKRLQHASPAHIHATSRRCFIGPIPEAWLSRHRKSWYKYRPHLSTYSSKTATFDATANISFTRQLSSLDSQSQLHGSYTGPSFPQPDDISEEGPFVQVEPSSPDVPGSSQVEQLSEPPRTADTKTVSFYGGSPPQAQASGLAPQPQPLGRSVSIPRRVSVGKSSFVTAAESLGEQSSTQAAGPATLLPIESQGSQPEPSPSPGLRKSTTSSTDGTPGPTGKAAAMANSDSSLLRYEGIERTSSKASPPKQSSAPDDEAGQDGEEPAKPLREMNPVSTGLVHFDLSNRPDRNNLSPVSPAARPQASVFNSLFQSHTKPGELIKAERMLVRVDWTQSDLPAEFSENDSMKIESTTVQKWREFMIVCRRRGEDSLADGNDPDESFLLQMSKSRVLPMVDQRRTSSRCAYEIVLQRRVTRINMYSSLDKTIVLWSKWSKGTRIYLLRPRSSTSAVEWLTFLNTLLGWKRPEAIPIHVPDLNVTLNIEKPFLTLRAMQEQMEEQGQVDMRVLQDAAKGSVARDIIDRSIKLLEQSPVSDNLQTWLECGDRIGLAWKRYDRLEWVHGTNEEKMFGSMAMQQSHDLELRLKQHYPTTVHRSEEKKATLEEPAAVEGFLVRLTSQKGRTSRLGKNFYKRQYYSTHNQFLCFCQPANALPPKPPKLLSGSNIKNAPKASELVGKIPLIYAVNPFPLKDADIAWMKGRSPHSMQRMDELAQEESGRKIQTLLQAQGFINLCHIQEIRKVARSPAQAPPQSTEDPATSGDSTDEGSSLREDTRAAGSGSEPQVFELVLKNGLTVRLQAYDQLACHEWIKRLRRLSTYWKHRTAADMRALRDVRHRNLRALDIDEEMESSMGQFAQKWEVTRAIASAELFNMCGISCCRSVTMSGVLYYKPRLHAKFERCTVILCHGQLLLFQSTLRRRSGTEIPHIHHERRQVLDLENTYIYSGLITEGDLLYQNQTFDSNHPGHHALPRVYLEDRWTSSDEDTTTCFVIWHRKSRSVFKAHEEDEAGNQRQKLRYVSSLGRPGRAVVFKARSRAERDHWVMSISLEADRIAQTEDLRLVS